MSDSLNKMYRYEAKCYSVCVDPELEIYGVTPVKLELLEYKVAKETPCGHWIGFFGGKDRWVSKTSIKRFAHPTKEEALESYRIRKQCYVKHCLARLKRAQEELCLAETIK